jgi:steroid delta-isomerase-like uncharacterized protein
MAATPAQVARRWFEEVWNQRKDATIDELLAPDGVGHLAVGETRGCAEFRGFHKAILDAFPDQKVHVDYIVADASNAIVHWHLEATHTGPLYDLKPTGEKITIQGMTRLAVEDGQIVEGWDCWDSGKLMEKLRLAGA